jgi:hypothetical protein
MKAIVQGTSRLTTVRHQVASRRKTMCIDANPGELPVQGIHAPAWKCGSRDDGGGAHTVTE